MDWQQFWNFFNSRFGGERGNFGLGCTSLAMAFLALFALLYFLFSNLASPQSSPTEPSPPAFDETGCQFDWHSSSYAVSLDPTLIPTTTVDAQSWVRTIDRELASANPEQGERFANEYRVITTEQGKSIVHAATGDVIAYNLQSQGGISFRPDSTLLYINTGEERNGYNAGQHYSKDVYKLNQDGRLELLCSELAADRDEEFCGQVPLIITSDQTLERMRVGSDCRIPDQNWGVAIGAKATSPEYWETVK